MIELSHPAQQEKVYAIDITLSMREKERMAGRPSFPRMATVSDLSQLAARDVDAAAVPRLADAPDKANNPNPRGEQYWRAAQAMADRIGETPVLWANNAGMDVLLQRICVIGLSQTSAKTLAATLFPGEWRNLLEEARAAAASPRAGGFDAALGRVSAVLDKATAGYGGPVIVVQTGERLTPAKVKRLAEEELDHAKLIWLMRGRQGLPVQILETQNGQKAEAALVRIGYKKPNPKSPFFQHQRGVMVAEMGVRLMRPGLYREMGLTAQEARDLARQFLDGLVEEHGESRP